MRAHRARAAPAGSGRAARGASRSTCAARRSAPAAIRPPDRGLARTGPDLRRREAPARARPPDRRREDRHRPALALRADGAEPDLRVLWIAHQQALVDQTVTKRARSPGSAPRRSAAGRGRSTAPARGRHAHRRRDELRRDHLPDAHERTQAQAQLVLPAPGVRSRRRGPSRGGRTTTARSSGWPGENLRGDAGPVGDAAAGTARGRPAVRRRSPARVRGLAAAPHRARHPRPPRFHTVRTHQRVELGTDESEALRTQREIPARLLFLASNEERNRIVVDEYVRSPTSGTRRSSSASTRDGGRDHRLPRERGAETSARCTRSWTGTARSTGSARRAGTRCSSRCRCSTRASTCPTPRPRSSPGRPRTGSCSSRWSAGSCAGRRPAVGRGARGRLPRRLALAGAHPRAGDRDRRPGRGGGPRSSPRGRPLPPEFVAALGSCSSPTGATRPRRRAGRAARGLAADQPRARRLLPAGRSRVPHRARPRASARGLSRVRRARRRRPADAQPPGVLPRPPGAAPAYEHLQALRRALLAEAAEYHSVELSVGAAAAVERIRAEQLDRRRGPAARHPGGARDDPRRTSSNRASTASATRSWSCSGPAAAGATSRCPARARPPAVELLDPRERDARPVLARVAERRPRAARRRAPRTGSAHRPTSTSAGPAGRSAGPTASTRSTATRAASRSASTGCCARPRVVSTELLDFLVWHELLHHVLLAQGHDAQFMALEQAWPNAAELDGELATFHERYASL